MAEATQGEATIVGGRYRVMPEIRLEEFDRTHIEAFAVEDSYFALIVVTQLLEMRLLQKPRAIRRQMS